MVIKLSEDPNKFLNDFADSLEPKTHCCECTPGKYYQVHRIHIQYPNCNCNPKFYRLERNYQ